jgi:Protein of unknown function (DUF1822)
MFNHSITEILEIDSQATILKFSKEERNKYWLRVKELQKYSNDAARWNAYLNSICLNVVSQWLRKEIELSNPIIESPSNLWEFVNGASLTIGDRRIALIPSDAIVCREFIVPQEWVDIPRFVADYYLAVQIIPDELSLNIWGVTTHLELKNKGEYDSFDRNYILDRDELIDDMDALIVSLEICPQQRAAIKALPQIFVREAEKTIEQLSKHCPYLPRLEVNFSQWGAVLENDEWRQKLYERRNPPVISLLQWIVERIVPPLWVPPQELYLIPASRGDNPRDNNSILKDDAKTTKQITGLIEQIDSSDSDEAQLQIAAGRLGNLGIQTPEIIDCLVKLIHTTANEETRWTAAESLWKLDPNHLLHSPNLGVILAIDLGMQLANSPLALAVGILQKSDNKVAILVQVYSRESQKCLPAGCQFIVLDEDNQVFIESDIAGEQTDQWITKRFSGVRGDRFGIKILLGDSCIGKDFLI